MTVRTRAFFASAALLISTASGGGLSSSNYVLSNLGLRSTPAGQLSTITRYGFNAPNDGGRAEYNWSPAPCSLNAGAGDDGSQVAPGSGSGCWLIAKQSEYDVRIWGVMCDFNFATNKGTDNTRALGAAIAFSETGVSQGAGARLSLCDGAILSGPQTVTGQIEIEGRSAFATALVLKSGSNAPMLTYLTKGYNFPADGHPNGQTFARRFRITSQDGFGANAKYPNAHGISLPSGGAWSLWAYFDDITIYSVPGAGIFGRGSGGLAYFRRPYVEKVGGNGIDTNSTSDWVFDGANVSQSQGDADVLSAGDSSIYYHNLNAYAAKGHGVHLYGRITATFDGHTEINMNGQGGLFLHGLTHDAVVRVSDLDVGDNSREAPAKWSDVHADGAGTVKITRGNFPAPYAFDKQNSSRLNIEYAKDATTSMSCTDCIFSGGAWNSPGVTNNTTNFSSK